MKVIKQKGVPYCINCSGKKDLSSTECYVINMNTLQAHLCLDCMRKLAEEIMKLKNATEQREEIYEFCPYCEKKVELANIFIKQKCPNCGKEIYPCGICPHIAKDEEASCNDCPLRRLKV